MLSDTLAIPLSIAQNDAKGKRPSYRVLVGIIRLAITGGLLAVLFYRVDAARIAALVKGVAIVPLVFALLVLIAANLINAIRWHSILSAMNGSPGPKPLMMVTLVGLFFNQILPTGVGGDAVRAWRCRLLGMRLGEAVRSILLDRAVGYTVIVIAGVFGFPILYQAVPDPLIQDMLMLVLGAAIAGLVALFGIDLLPAFLLRHRFLAPLALLSIQARSLVGKPRLIIAILSLSVISLVLYVWSYELVGHSLGAQLSFYDWFLIVPPVTLIQLIPVSVAGWGLREAALVTVAAGFGTSAEMAVSVSLLYGVSQLICGLPGGLVWLMNYDLRCGRVEAGRPMATDD